MWSSDREARGLDLVLDRWPQSVLHVTLLATAFPDRGAQRGCRARGRSCRPRTSSDGARRCTDVDDVGLRPGDGFLSKGDQAVEARRLLNVGLHVGMQPVELAALAVVIGITEHSRTLILASEAGAPCRKPKLMLFRTTTPSLVLHRLWLRTSEANELSVLEPRHTPDVHRPEPIPPAQPRSILHA